METVSNVTVSVLTSGITMATVGTLLGVISTHRLLSQLGYFLGRGTRRSGLGYGCRPRPAHTPGVALATICRSARWGGWGKAHGNAGAGRGFSVLSL